MKAGSLSLVGYAWIDVRIWFLDFLALHTHQRVRMKIEDCLRVL